MADDSSPSRIKDKGKTRYLSCHCQTHVASIDLPSDNPFPDNGTCDCSHCLKRRIIWAVAPEGSVKIVKGFGKDGTEELKAYEFGAKEFKHYFCEKCGTIMPSPNVESQKGQLMYNLRALRDPDFVLWDLPLKLYSGRNRPTPYIEPTLSLLPSPAHDFLKSRQAAYDYPTEIYVGSCHCQKIMYGVVSRKLEDEKCRIMDCCCSICQGNGAVWIYPGRRNVYFHPSVPSQPWQPQPGLLTEYGFLNRENLHYSCTTCGCHIFEYGARPVEDPRPPQARTTPWDAENGYNGSFGLNIALVGEERGVELLGDLLGLGQVGEEKEGRAMVGEGGKGEGTEWKVGKIGVTRDRSDLTAEPIYRVNL